MTNVPQKSLVRRAVSKRNRFDMSSQVVTTNNFGIMKPIYLRYCVPGDEITNCEVREFQRLMPLPSPTFGRLESITRAFFVPCRSVFLPFNEFISQNYNPFSATGSGSLLTPKLPSTCFRDLNLLFTSPLSGLTSVGTSNHYDFYSRKDDGISTYYLFTLKGKRTYDLFNSIGLQFPWLHADQMNTSVGDTEVCILPLLAVLKLYYDWVVPSRFINSYQNLQGFINSTVSRTTNGVTYKVLNNVLFELRSWLEDDFFTSAFESPNGQTSQGNTSFTASNPINDVNSNDFKTFVSSAKDSKGNDYAAAWLSPNSSAGLDVWTLKTLGALQSMLTRGMLTGTKIQDWLETTFGMRASNDALNISTYLGKQVNNISIGDVTSYADTTGNGGASLGQFAGKGVGSGSSNFKYKVKEHGYFIITNEILPRTTYYQGLDPVFQMKDCYDFFQPDFDNIGCDAIPLKTLVSVSDQKAYPNAATSLTDPNQVFGFCPRYAQLKTAFDRVSGDFRVPSINTGLDSWYLARDMRLEVGFDEDYKHISASFCDASTGTSTNNYDRIFQDTSNNDDHFYQVFYVDCNMSRPMKSVSQFALEMQEDGDVTSVKTNGGIN